jgi:hypothetical protein
MSQSVAREPWDPDRIGMNVLHPWQPWEHGGPSVQHSEWWLREHWGRAFDVESVQDSPEFGHGLIVLTKRPVTLTREALIAPARDEPREVTALSHNRDQLLRELIELNAALRVEGDAPLRAERDAAREAFRVIATSRSWQLTKPLRAAAARVRARRSR